jgi:hypothetical protein
VLLITARSWTSGRYDCDDLCSKFHYNDQIGRFGCGCAVPSTINIKSDLGWQKLVMQNPLDVNPVPTALIVGTVKPGYKVISNKDNVVHKRTSNTSELLFFS